MNFEEILNEWESSTAKPYGKKRLVQDAREDIPMKKQDDAVAQYKDAVHPSSEKKAHPVDVWLRRYGLEDKDSTSEFSQETPAQRRRRLHSMKPDAVLDLHGCTRDEAWSRLESFFADCIQQKLEKVLIIHGKGNHSGDNPVLKDVVRLYIEKNKNAGESGQADKHSGSTGATWVIIKNKQSMEKGEYE